MLETVKKLKRKTRKKRKYSKIGGGFFNPTEKIKLLKTHFDRHSNRIKTQADKNLYYTISNNPITIYLKYHQYCKGVIMKHMPRCMSLITDYHLGKLIFSILDYLNYLSNDTPTIYDILLPYVYTYMKRIYRTPFNTPIETSMMMNKPKTMKNGVPSDKIYVFKLLTYFIAQYHNKKHDQHYEYYYLIYHPNLTIYDINKKIQDIENIIQNSIRVIN